MRLARDRTIGHSAGGETLDNIGGGFNLLERHGLAALLFRSLDAEQTTDGEELFVLLVQELGIGAEFVAAVAAHSMLQHGHGFRRPVMRLAALAIGIFTADFERSAVNWRIAKGIGMAAHGFFRHLLKANTFDCRRGAKEIAVNKGLLQANRVKNLRAAIGLIGRNAHLGHDLQNALINRLDKALHHLIGIHLLGKFWAHGVQRLEGQIGVDGLRAIASETAEVMHLTRIAGFNNQAHRGTQTFADQVMMHSRRAEQGRDRNTIRAHHAVRQDDDIIATMYSRLSAVTQTLQRIHHAGGTLFHRISHIQCFGVESILDMADIADLLQITIGQNWLTHFQPFAAGVALQIKQVRARADKGHKAHHQLFTDRIDRRIGDLRKVLLEIGIEQLGLVREYRNRRVCAHRADSFLTRDCHGSKQNLQVFLTIAKGLLTVEQGHIGAGRARGDRLEVFQYDLGALQPLAIRRGGRERLFHFLIGNDAALLQIHQQHLAGLQTPLGNDFFLRNWQNAHFGRHNHKTVIGDEIARRAQAVAVERCANLAAIGKGDSGRPVPLPRRVLISPLCATMR